MTPRSRTSVAAIAALALALLGCEDTEPTIPPEDPGLDEPAQPGLDDEGGGDNANDYTPPA